MKIYRAVLYGVDRLVLDGEGRVYKCSGDSSYPFLHIDENVGPVLVKNFIIDMELKSLSETT